MTHRTYGETVDCKGCRYWSEMLAKSNGHAIVAMCLGDNSPLSGKWVRGSQTCDAWETGEDGAVDEPGSDPLRYE